MSEFNLNTNHPLIPNSNEYQLEHKFVSISSEDRNIIKYPNTSDFEIELPQDIYNVTAVKLSNWSFPSDFRVFSKIKNNLMMTFKINNPFNPSTYINSIQSTIYDAIVDLNDAQQIDFVVYIEEGQYSPSLMVTELTNKMNEAVTNAIVPYFQTHNPTDLPTFLTNGGYDQFVVMYNEVSNKITFGNRSSGFIITNSSSLYLPYFQNNKCIPRAQSYNYWGLPAYLGFIQENVESIEQDNYVRVYYGDVVTGDNGIWLTADNNGDYINDKVYYLEAPFVLNLLGENYIYIDIPELNNIDETKPYSPEKPQPNYFVDTNATNGSVNAAFAKIEFPLFQGFKTYESNSESYKLYNPPRDRLRKLRIKIRYHDGQLVEFDRRNYSILLQFIILRPNVNRKVTIQQPEKMGF